MSAMVELVARAIFAGFDEVTEPEEREDCFRIARAAIAAMRKPTVGMLCVLTEGMVFGRDDETTPEELMGALIDEALK